MTAAAPGRAKLKVGGMASRWWPVPTLLVAVITIQIVVSSRYDARGHAEGHLSSASAVYGATFLVGVALIALRRSLWRRAALWLIGGTVVASSAIAALGNLRVVDAIGGENWSEVDTERLGPAQPGFAAGHGLAEYASWVTVVSTSALTLWLWRNQRLSNAATIAAITITFLVPPWIFPGAGLAVIAVATVVGRDSSRSATMPPEPAEWQPVRRALYLTSGV